MAEVHITGGGKIIGDAIAALTVWSASAPRGEDLTVESASPFQVAARAIYDFLGGAEEAAESVDGFDFMYGRALVNALDMALWNFMSHSDIAPPTGAQLASTAAMASGHLARALKEIQVATSPEVQHA